MARPKLPDDERRKRKAERNNRYRKENVRQLSVRFYPSEMELLEYVKSHDTTSSYVKKLIRADMERNGK